ncbi:MAG: ferritin-like domain-containing protein [Deltaproteobacteria bacterium]
MHKHELIDRLITLARLDLDASRLYGQAVRNIGEPEVRRTLEGFLADHDDHVAALSGMLEQMGQLAPVSLPESRDFFTAGIQPLTETESPGKTLEDLLLDERAVLTIYRQQMSPALPGEESRLIDGNIADEERHVRYLEQAVREMSVTAGKGRRR